MLIRGFVCIILSFLALNTTAQVANIPVLYPTLSEKDEWDERISPLIDAQELVALIYNEPFREEFIFHIPAGYPLTDEVNVNSHYGVRNHPVHNVVKFHKGTDLKSKTGDLVVTTGDGFVLQTGFDKGLGNFVKIRHKYGFESVYGHLSAISVKKGKAIKKGETVGKVGATGTVTGPHLHYTIKKNGFFMDPFDFLFMKFD